MSLRAKAQGESDGLQGSVVATGEKDAAAQAWDQLLNLGARMDGDLHAPDGNRKAEGAASARRPPQLATVLCSTQNRLEPCPGMSFPLDSSQGLDSPQGMQKNILRTENKTCTLLLTGRPFVGFSNPGHKEWEQ